MMYHNTTEGKRKGLNNKVREPPMSSSVCGAFGDSRIRLKKDLELSMIVLVNNFRKLTYEAMVITYSRLSRTYELSVDGHILVEPGR